MGHFGEDLSELLEKKLTVKSMNFCEWIHDMRVALRDRKLEHVLDTPVPHRNEDYSPLEEDEYMVAVMMQERMSNELSDCYPHLRPFLIMEALKARFSFQI